MSTTAIFLNHVATLAFFHIADIVHTCVHAKSLQSCPTLCDPMDQPARLLFVDSPGKNTGVGCHALLHGIFWPRDWIRVACGFCIAGGFFTYDPRGMPQKLCYLFKIFCVFSQERNTPGPPPHPLGTEFIPFWMIKCTVWVFWIFIFFFYYLEANYFKIL